MNKDRKDQVRDVSDCSPMDCSLLGSSIHGIFQARGKNTEVGYHFLLPGIFRPALDCCLSHHGFLLWWENKSRVFYPKARLFSGNCPSGGAVCCLRTQGGARYRILQEGKKLNHQNVVNNFSCWSVGTKQFSSSFMRQRMYISVWLCHWQTTQASYLSPLGKKGEGIV